MTKNNEPKRTFWDYWKTSHLVLGALATLITAIAGLIAIIPWIEDDFLGSSTKTSTSKGDISGVWEQYSSSTAHNGYKKLGEILVTNKNGEYIMTPKEQSKLSINTLSIFEVMYDGKSWKFKSYWRNGDLVSFKLNKVSDNRFEGFVYANGQVIQNERWIKIE